MRPIFKASLLLVAAVALGAAAGTITPEWPPSSIQYTFGEFLGANGPCPAEGKPKNPTNLSHFDPILNRLKNRDKEPANGPMAMKLSTIFKKKVDQAMAMARAGTHREVWTSGARSQVRTYENRYVQIEGYFAGVDKQGAESCNCYSAEDVDFHLWLAPHKPSEFPGQKHIKHHSMVAEISPRTLLWHPDWTEPALKAIFQSETKVRITGWLMFDQEHPENVYPIPPGQGGAPNWNPGPVIKYKTRRTLWEIHPVHRIEFLDANGEWEPLGSS